MNKNLHSIQIAYMRYAIDHDDEFPDSIAQIQALTPEGQWPTNPYTGEPMKHVSLGDNPEPGDYTLLGLRYPDRPVDKYEFHLLAFGNRRNHGRVLDIQLASYDVVVDLSSGFDNTTAGHFGPPSLEEAIKLTNGGAQIAIVHYSEGE